MRALLQRLDIRVALIYGAVAALWILFSDSLLPFLFAQNPDAATAIGTLKGLGFVAVTTGLLFAVLSVELRKRMHVEDALRRDLAERQRMQAALFEAEEKYRGVFEAAYDMIVLSDRDGNILDVNRRAESVLGYTRDELRGMNTFRDFYEPEDVPLMRQVFQDLTEGRSREYEASIHTRDGRIIHFAGASAPRFDAEGKFVSTICATRDISERLQANRDIHNLNRQLEVLHELDRGIIEARSLQSLVAVTVRHLRELIPCRRATLALVDREANEWDVIAVDADYDTPVSSGARVPISAGWFDAFGDESSRIVPDLLAEADLPEEHRILAREGMRSVLNALIAVQDGPIGILSLSTAEPGYFTGQHAQIVTGIAGQLTIAVRQWQMADALARHAAELEQKVAERTADLKQEKDRVETILNNSSDGIALVRPDLTVAHANPEFAAMFGLSAGDAVGRSLRDCIAPGDLERVEAAVAASFAENAVRRLEVAARRQDGTGFDVKLSIGIPTGGSVVCLLADITERKQAERQLRYQAILQENVGEAVIAADMDHRIRSWNRAAEQIYGWRAEEVLGKPVNEVIPSEFADGIELDTVQRDFVETGTWVGEAIQRHRDGSVVHVLGSTVLLKDDNGEPFAIVSVNHDITARKREELARRESEFLYRLLAENITDMVARYSRTGEFIYVSPSIELLLGYTPEDMLGRSAYEILHPDDAALVEAWHRAQLEPRDAGPLLYRLRHKDGHYVWLEATAKSIVSEESGAVVEIVASSRDVTARKNAEEALKEALESEKELGELKTRFVSMASHEFRTPLATILALTETLSAYRHKMSDDQIAQRFGKIKEQIEHLTSIMDDVLLLSRMEARRVQFNPLRVNLDALCRDLLDEFQSRGDVEHTFAYRINGTPRDMVLDRRLMQQILSNVVSNAIKYSPPERPVAVTLEFDNAGASITVRDEGIGIPEADLKHLFEPFHRAANVGTVSGTGLGLVIAKEAVELHGGSIGVESRVGEGSTFVIRLPEQLQPALQTSA